MPSHLKAVVVVLVLAALVFTIAKAPACAVATTPSDFERRRNLWFAITLTAFLAHNFWIYIVVTGALLVFASQREENKLAMYFFLLFAVPFIPEQIPGLGVIQHFFVIHYGRLLALLLLLPAFLHLRKQPDVEPIGRSIYDKFLLGYLVLQFALMVVASTFTNSLRHGFFYAFIDVFLPYYVASRSLRSLQGFRDAIMAFAVGAMVLAAIGIFELLVHWLLYAALDDALGVNWNYGRYLEREVGVLRGQGTAGQPIPFGFAMAVAFGLFLYLKKSVSRTLSWRLGLALLVAGLVASISRGPWVGAVAMLIVYVATSPDAGRRVATLGMLGIVTFSLLLATPAGEKMMQYLPFVGTIENKNIDFRQRLIEIAFGVILQNPFFGAFDYIYSPALQDLKTGSAGFIDIVNTYVSVGLTSGLVGLSLFVGFFLLVEIGIFRSMRNVADRSSEQYLLGQVLFATLAGILLIIFTTSSITVIPLIYWSVAGLGIAYVRLLATATVESLARAQGEPRKGSAPYSRPVSAHTPAS